MIIAVIIVIVVQIIIGFVLWMALTDCICEKARETNCVVAEYYWKTVKGDDKYDDA